MTVGNSSDLVEDRGYAYDAAWNLNYRTNDGATSWDVSWWMCKNQLTNAYGAGPTAMTATAT